jgi:glycosyltransferase involved in cell wall biosynthesis
MRICIATDAWAPQTNGVVRTLNQLARELTDMGHELLFITPQDFHTIPCPTYPEIRLSLAPGAKLSRLIRQFQPDAIHISTEGPLGMAARRFCLTHRLPFTTAYHTRLPEYVHARLLAPVGLTYAWLRWFHRPSSAVMVPSQSIAAELESRGFTKVSLWGRGVDASLFHPAEKSWLTLPRPVFLYVGRVSVEKNIGAFLDAPLEGTKLVVGDGPQLRELKQRYPQAVFVGAKHGQELAAHYAAADVFVFPSRTDTFGNVMLEALACGIPVAAYPVPGPLDVLTDPAVGCMDEDLAKAAHQALGKNSEHCRQFAARHSWRHSAEQFVGNLHPFAWVKVRQLVRTV